MDDRLGTSRSARMTQSMHQWDPTSGVSWAMLLGMVHVPMFGARKQPKGAEETAILLDGPRASFAFLRTSDVEFAETPDPLSWSWSSCVRHMVAVLPGKRMYVRRWDDPQTTCRFEIPPAGMGAVSLLEMLEGAARPRRPDVVRYVLESFRRIRARIGANESLWAVRFLNGLLLAAESVRKHPGRRKDVKSIQTFADAFTMLQDRDRKVCGLMDLPPKAANLEAGDLVRELTTPDPYTGCELHPILLFRHAASKLYQEAHLEIERSFQPYLYGLEPTNEPPASSLPRDVRFTPPNLARALVQKALEELQEPLESLTILDPACGSGVFLVEGIRELSTSHHGRTRAIKAVGYDISDISEYTTRFCLEYATHSTGSRCSVHTEVAKCDSLERAWVPADIILMNPPFIPWERLSAEQRSKVCDTLGDLHQQRPDMAMAFVTKAVRSLRPGGVLGCVLPASLLTSRTGLTWRKNLSEQGSVRLIGCFEGYKYFPTSFVETAFLIYRKQAEQRERPKYVDVLISNEGSEDAALRALRLGPKAGLPTHGVEHFERPAHAFTPESWRPLRQGAYDEKDRIVALPLPRTGSLFEIRQGVRLGHSAFLLRSTQYQELTDREKPLFFRPAAGGGSIRNGQLLPTEYVFYPYATDGTCLIRTEAELQSRLPNYYSGYLKPAKPALTARNGFETTWWELYRKRSWQATLSPRLVSTYFGESGSFAFDDAGKHVTVNGHAWVWAKGPVPISADMRVPFEQTPAVWAYLAVLNSRAFERIVSLFSLRLQGGQLRLEKRFLSQVPLPDLTDDTQYSADVVSTLAALGRSIHAGELGEVAEEADRLVSLLYGLT